MYRCQVLDCLGAEVHSEVVQLCHRYWPHLDVLFLLPSAWVVPDATNLKGKQECRQVTGFVHQQRTIYAKCFVLLAIFWIIRFSLTHKVCYEWQIKLGLVFSSASHNHCTSWIPEKWTQSQLFGGSEKCVYVNSSGWPATSSLSGTVQLRIRIPSVKSESHGRTKMQVPTWIPLKINDVTARLIDLAGRCDFSWQSYTNDSPVLLRMLAIHCSYSQYFGLMTSGLTIHFMRHSKCNLLTAIWGPHVNFHWFIKWHFRIHLPDVFLTTVEDVNSLIELVIWGRFIQNVPLYTYPSRIFVLDSFVMCSLCAEWNQVV